MKMDCPTTKIALITMAIRENKQKQRYLCTYCYNATSKKCGLCKNTICVLHSKNERNENGVRTLFCEKCCFKVDILNILTSNV